METRSGKLCSAPIGSSAASSSAGQFNRQICRCRLLRYRILAFTDCRPYILPARAFFQTKNAHETKNSWLRNLIRHFPRIRPRPLARSIHAVGPGISTLLNSLQIFFLAAIGFFFYSERLSTLQIFKFDIGHHRRSLNRQPRVRS